MKTTKFKFTTLLVLFYLFSGTIISQNKDIDQNIVVNDSSYVKEKDSSYVLADVSFINDAVFMGRKDSIAAPYLYPSIMYHNKSGLYAKGSFSYLTGSEENRIDLFLLTAGFDFTSKKLEGDISVTKYFFNDDSYNVISEVEIDLTASFKYDFSIINLGIIASTYLNKGDDSDFFLSSEISHDFMSSDNKFQFSPTAGIHLGSQNFYEQYYINNRFGNRKGGSGQGSGSQQTAQINIQESENFDIMAIEFSLPIWFTDNSFIISFIPSFVLPQNEPTLLIEDSVIKENLENTFYWILGVGYKF
ncbi:hypothetical protein C7447_101677 [Tenacibaculum adriaticum]|uniref:Outer membrane protein n=1 Tax=Tenacibaculum adriaticum TaxID=413713 RepID=A0A5S5DXS9_9FLAO|nr:hypothetical protein [Tenacibaculum adriaticum]TYQ00069.1 hypothetical protein C7447_101677 [Tenacibaculum adriaticum]